MWRVIKYSFNLHCVLSDFHSTMTTHENNIPSNTELVQNGDELLTVIKKLKICRIALYLYIYHYFYVYHLLLNFKERCGH